MNKNKTLASQLINQIVEKDFVGAKDSFVSLICQKSLTRLGEKKIEVASRMFVSEAEQIIKPNDIVRIKASVYDPIGKKIRRQDWHSHSN